MIPLRSVGNRLVLAASEASLPRAKAELGEHVKMDVRFVVVDAADLHHAIATHYESKNTERRAAPGGRGVTASRRTADGRDIRWSQTLRRENLARGPRFTSSKPRQIYRDWP